MAKVGTKTLEFGADGTGGGALAPARSHFRKRKPCSFRVTWATVEGSKSLTAGARTFNSETKALAFAGKRSRKEGNHVSVMGICYVGPRIGGIRAQSMHLWKCFDGKCKDEGGVIGSLLGDGVTVVKVRKPRRKR